MANAVESVSRLLICWGEARGEQERKEALVVKKEHEGSAELEAGAIAECEKERVRYLLKSLEQRSPNVFDHALLSVKYFSACTSSICVFSN